MSSISLCLVETCSSMLRCSYSISFTRATVGRKTRSPLSRICYVVNGFLHHARTYICTEEWWFGKGAFVMPCKKYCSTQWKNFIFKILQLPKVCLTLKRVKLWICLTSLNWNRWSLYAQYGQKKGITTGKITLLMYSTYYGPVSIVVRFDHELKKSTKMMPLVKS